MMELGRQVVAIVLVLSLALGPTFIALWFVTRRKRLAGLERRSPLTVDLLRSPGYTLREQLDDLRSDVGSEITVLAFIGMMPLAFFYVQSRLMERMPALWVHVVVFTAATLFIVYRVRLLLRQSIRMDKLRLGLDAELAVGQELDQLMRQGAAVFHDFPAEKFNIDHVVVSRGGVFAVETKGRPKPKDMEGREAAMVRFDGRALAFPKWTETKPIEQAERQARWLQDWLSKAVGEPVYVTGAVALPGWFVEHKGHGPVWVFSGRNLGFLVRPRNREPLSDKLVQQIAHQVEQRCRTVKPLYLPPEQQDGQ